MPSARSASSPDSGWGSISTVVVDQYDHHKPLPAMRRNVNAIAEMLIAAGFTSADVHIAGDVAGRENLDAAVRAWQPDGERAVLYWAGHGKTLENGAFYLCCAGTPAKAEPDSGTAIAAAHLGELLATKQVQQMVLIVDACGAGGGAGQIATAFRNKVARTSRAATMPGLSVITSAGLREKAREGTFHAALTKVLREGAPYYPGSLLWTDRDAYITPPDLADAVRRGMEHAPVRQSPEHNMVNSVGRFFPNPRYRGDLPDVEVEKRGTEPFLDADILDHFMVKFRGIDAATHFGWYFTGREDVLRSTVSWLDRARSGMRVITGRPGCGKSAVLGRLAVLSFDKYRNQLELDGRLTGTSPDTVPRRGAIDAGVHAKGRTLVECLELLATALGIDAPAEGWQTAGEFVQAVARRPGPTTVLLDALDEAAADDAYAIAVDLLRPLAALRRVKVLVGTRPGQRGGEEGDRSLLAALGADAAGTVWLDQDARGRADITTYALTRLRDVEGSPYRDTDKLATATAARIADQSDGAFLVARLLAGTLARRALPADLRTAFLQRASSSVAEALAADLERYGADGERVQDLLTALAWAEGAGLPAHDVWLAVAAAVSGRTYTERDLRWVVDNAGQHIVESSADGQTAYRLFHQAYAEFFRLGANEERTQAAIADRLIELAGRRWTAADPYLLRHLAAHAAIGGRLDALCQDPGFLRGADPGRLEQVLQRLDHRPRPLVRLYWRALHRLRRSEPGERAAILHEVAVREEPDALPLLGDTTGLPWWGRWCRISRSTFHRALYGHLQVIFALSPDASRRGLVASASGDHTVRVWNAVSGEHRGTFAGHRAPVLATALGHVSGRTVLASGDVHGTIRVVDVDTGALLAERKLRTGFASTFAFVETGPRQPRLAIGDDEGYVQLCSLPYLNTIDKWQAHTDRVRAIVMTTEPYGAPVMVTGGDDGRVHFWAPGEARRLRSITTRTWVCSLATAVMDGRLLLAIGGLFGTVRLWNGVTCELVGSCHGHRGAVGAVAFGSYGGDPVLASAGDDGGVRLWDALTGAPRQVLLASTDVPLTQLEMRQGPAMELGTREGTPGAGEDDEPPAYVARRSNSLTALTFVAHDLRSVMLSGGADGIVRLWHMDDIAQRKPTEAAPHIVSAVWGEFEDRPSLITGDRAGRLTCWDGGTGRVWAELPATVAARGTPVVVPSRPDDLIVAATETQGALRWNPVIAPESSGRLTSVVGRAVELRQDGDRSFLLVATAHDTIDEVRLDTEARRTVCALGYSILHLQFDPPSGLLALAGLRDEVLVVDVRTGERVRTLTTDSEVIQLTCWHRSGHESLMAAATRKGLYIWNMRSGHRINRWSVLGDRNTIALAVVPGTDLLVLGDQDGRVSAIDYNTGGTVLELPRHTQPVRAIACTTGESGTMVATCGDDGIHVIGIDRAPHLSAPRPTFTPPRQRPATTDARHTA